MAKRKKRGAAYGKRTGGNSKLVSQRRERKRLGTYALFGVLGFLVLCLLLWMVSRSGSNDSAAINDNSDAEAGLVESDSGFEASSESIDESGGEEGFASSAESSDTEGFSASSDSADADGFSASSDSSTVKKIDDSQFSLLEGDYTLLDLDPPERNAFYDAYPEFTIDLSKVYDAIIVTEKGNIRVRLFDDESPLAVNNFVFLAQDGFYDSTSFHRVLEGFMAQGGDPLGTGAGGPGYVFDNEVDNGLSFDRGGLLAMANAGPDTNGSQFFITFGPTPRLTGGYTIFGEVIEGMDVLNTITFRDPLKNPTEEGDLIEAIDIYVADE